MSLIDQGSFVLEIWIRFVVLDQAEFWRTIPDDAQWVIASKSVESCVARCCIGWCIQIAITFWNSYNPCSYLTGRGQCVWIDEASLLRQCSMCAYFDLAVSLIDEWRFLIVCFLLWSSALQLGGDDREKKSSWAVKILVALFALILLLNTAYRVHLALELIDIDREESIMAPMVSSREIGMFLLLWLMLGPLASTDWKWTTATFCIFFTNIQTGLCWLLK